MKIVNNLIREKIKKLCKDKSKRKKGKAVPNYKVIRNSYLTSSVLSILFHNIRKATREMDRIFKSDKKGTHVSGK